MLIVKFKLSLDVICGRFALVVSLISVLISKVDNLHKNLHLNLNKKFILALKITRKAATALI